MSDDGYDAYRDRTKGIFAYWDNFDDEDISPDDDNYMDLVLDQIQELESQIFGDNPVEGE